MDDKVTMELKGEQYEVRAEDLIRLKELGRGAYGVVETMRHPPSGVIMAVKVQNENLFIIYLFNLYILMKRNSILNLQRIHVSLNSEERKRMKNEVNANLASGRCPFMVHFYGAMFREGDVWLCMEVMDTSLDKIINMCADQHRQFPEPVCGKIAYSVCGI